MDVQLPTARERGEGREGRGEIKMRKIKNRSKRTREEKEE